MAKITFLSIGQTVSASVGEKLVDVCNRETSPILFGCQDGVCGTCLSTVKKGNEYLSEQNEQEKETLELYAATEKQRLICQCAIVKDGDIEIDEV